METQAQLKRKIDNAEDLHSVVSTMKSLAAVNIRHYEKSKEALREYERTVELGLRIVMSDITSELDITRTPPTGLPPGLVVYGAEQGMAGQFNRRLVAYVEKSLREEFDTAPASARVIVLGDRIVPTLEDAGFGVEDALRISGSAEDMSPVLLELLLRIEGWRGENAVGRIVLFYNRQISGSSFEPGMSSLIPVNPDWLAGRRHARWDSRTIPTYFMDRDTIFSALMRQYFFVSLYRGFMESLAAENASRLSTMQAAESNIEDRIEELTTRYNRERQKSITEEIMDIINGYESLQ